jgi:hypothetical protein
MNHQRHRHIYQIQERKRQLHKCNQAKLLPLHPPQDIVSTTVVLKNITATRKQLLQMNCSLDSLPMPKGDSVKAIRANFHCCVLMGLDAGYGRKIDSLGNPGMAKKLKILATQNQLWQFGGKLWKMCQKSWQLTGSMENMSVTAGWCRQSCGT